MFVPFDDYKNLLKSNIQGSWSQIDEYNKTGLLPVRITDIRKYDSRCRVYFNDKREQVITGNRLSMVSRSPFRLSKGNFYKVVTDISIIKQIPDTMTGLILGNPDLQDAGVMYDQYMLMPGYTGDICLNILLNRDFEMDAMCCIGFLGFSLLNFKKPVRKSKKKEEQGDM